MDVDILELNVAPEDYEGMETETQAQPEPRRDQGSADDPGTRTSTGRAVVEGLEPKSTDEQPVPNAGTSTPSAALPRKKKKKNKKKKKFIQ